MNHIYCPQWSKYPKVNDCLSSAFLQVTPLCDSSKAIWLSQDLTVMCNASSTFVDWIEQSAIKCNLIIDIQSDISLRFNHRKEVNQMLAYCMKCRTKREMKDAKAITMKNGRPATQGVCPTCGTKMFRIGKA